MIGSATKTPYFGDFEFRKVLTVRQLLAVEHARDRLSAFSETISDEGQIMAGALATLSQSIISAPDWWKASNNGEDLPDLNLVFEVLQAAAKVRDDYQEEMNKKASEAKPA